MLPLEIESKKSVWDPTINEFVPTSSGVLMLEHSLLSISKWESKYHKSFLKTVKNKQITNEEIRYYIVCMTVNNVSPDIYNGLTKEHIDKILDYISDPMTATVIREAPGTGKGNMETITSELIYYWMVFHDIPFECQKWHLNRLMTLIRICNVKNTPGKKMGKRDIMSQNRSLNAARRARHRSKG